jgi:pilus assembly protein CpaC
MTRHMDSASASHSRKKALTMRTNWRSIRWTIYMGALLLAPVWAGQRAAGGPATEPALRENARQQMLPGASGQQRILITVGSSSVIDAKQSLTRASVGTPDVVDVAILSPLQALVTGKAVGMSQVILWDKNNGQAVYDVMVEPDLTQLRSAIAQAAPGVDIGVKVVRDSIILLGKVPDVDTSERIANIARVLSPNVQNQLTIAGEQQVLLRCTVAEINKGSLRQLGINGWLAGDNIRDVFAVNQIDGINPTNIGAVPTANIIQPGGLLFGTDPLGIPMQQPPGGPTFSLGFPRVQMQLFFKAMRENTLLKVLAEPNLTALNGQTAKFVVGGEFPVPIPQGVGGAVTIEFKEFGIRLTFQPTVIGRQMIRLKVEPEVSELDFTTAVTLSGFSVPGLKKRSAQTTIEMASGSTIAIAGLLSENVRAFARKVPGVGDVPVLGALFSSVEYKKEITDLVILVTPELVSPMHPDQVASVPGQYTTAPNDWQLFGLGMVEGEPECDDSVPSDALDTATAPKYRKYASSPEEMSLHGPWGSEDSSEHIVQ